MINQDVALFSGTVRSNLDPFEQYSDVDCLDVLRRCHLTDPLKRRHTTTSNILDMPIDKGGSLSAGERQLMALARAILRRTSVIIMDEATSQIDVELDEEVCRLQIQAPAYARLTSHSSRSSVQSTRNSGAQLCSLSHIGSILCLTTIGCWSWGKGRSWSSIPLPLC